MFNSNKLYILLLLTVFLAKILAQTNYCNRTLCDAGEHHIACNNDGSFLEDCGYDAEIITLNEDLINLIVNKHNTLRNKVAQGFEQFRPAESMATMRWCDELSKLAELNVKQCIMEHDECRNTNTFQNVGQNLAVSSWMGMEKTIPNVIENHIQMWFNEYKDCPMSSINNYSSNTNGKVIGHFTAMMQEKATHIGCGVLRHTSWDGYTEQLMACNYAYTNIIDRPVYKAGVRSSKCRTGVNSKYTCLCSPKETYDVNE